MVRTLNELEAALTARTACVAVVGQGYVGLPLSLAFAEAGFPVVGLEADPERVASLTRGESYVPDIAPEALQAALRAGFRPTGDSAALAGADAILITVPTPYTKTKQPDMTYVQQAARSTAAHLRAGQLVVLESTTYPGTTEELLIPELERSGLSAGRDFEVAYSPERIEPGNRRYGLRNTPKVVGGATDRAGRLAELLYGAVVEEVVRVSTPAAAEMAKLLENTYRHVNIALVNEMAQICHRMGIDVWEVVRAASSKPFGFAPFYPGPGVGGHCIPIDPYYLVWKAQESEMVARLVEVAGHVNEAMPDWVVQRTADLLNERGKSLKDSRLLLVGVTYKRDVPDLRESPALRVLERLSRKGAVIEYHDPHVPELPWQWSGLVSVPLDRETVARADCVLLLTDHSGLDLDLLAREAAVVLDTRNALAGRTGPNVVRL